MLLKIIVLLVFLTISFAQSQLNRCESKATCAECVQHPNCAWQIQTDEKNHCKSTSQEDENNENMINPKTEAKIVKQDSHFGQLNISTVDLKIRPGRPYTLKFDYKHNKNVPIDMYFIMDMSRSMEGYRKAISRVAESLFKEMMQMSGDIQIGFGSFVDKTVVPYSNALPDKIEEIKYEGSTKPYSFKNHLKLTKNVDEFSRRINSTPISANIDGPEGSLEALLQATVCNDEIGWRNSSRHWIILSTDDAFHVAGDGKLAGIVEPNDGECHLENDTYTHGLLHDYPSIGLIADRIMQKSKNILFLVTPAQEKLYSELQMNIRNTYLGTWFDDANIIKILTDFYKNTTELISFDNNFPPEYFTIKMSTPNCNFKNNTCYIKTDKTLKLTVKIDLHQCPKDSNYSQTFFIKPGGLNERITIHTQMLCDCHCEHLGKDFIPNAEECNQQGDMTCGVCRCKEGKIGDKCQCDEKENLTPDDKNCENSATNEICSSNGVCNCGQCFCNNMFTGKYCECDTKKCLTNLKICSGNGICDCDKCICHENWSGEKCDCSKLKDNCMVENMECSGNGQCNCGKCKCNNNYRGQFCEDCINCPKSCNDFEHCVKCYYKDEKCENCTKFNFTITTNENFTENCTYKLDNCFVKYAFTYNEKTATAAILTSEECTATRAGFFYALYALLPFLLAGLLGLAIWLAIIQIQNKREYQKFLIEKEKTKWNAETNPLFLNPISEFQNPVFGKKED